jgi:hypothetical protein
MNQSGLSAQKSRKTRKSRLDEKPPKKILVKKESDTTAK